MPLRFHRRLSALLGLLLAVFPLSLTAGVFNPESFTLANGMQVVVIADHRAPIVTHMVWYKVGSADEPSGKSGIAHFLEHLMFRGTKTIPPGEFSKIIARNGGRDNAFTSYDYTGYFQNIAKDQLDLVMGMEAERMTGLVLTEEIVTPERQVIIEERRQRTDNNPRALLGEQMAAAQYLSHPYGIPVIGWLHEMKGLSRADALEFYRQHYTPNNAILIVAGDVKTAEVRRLAEKHYGSLARREIAPRLRRQEPPQIAARRVTLRDERVQNPAWSRTYLAPSLYAGERRHAYPLVLLAEILNGPTGRFQRQLVQNEGPALSASAWYDPNSFDVTRFGLVLTPRPGQSLEMLEGRMDALLAELIREGVKEEEVRQAQAQLIADATYERDNIQSVARIFGAALTSGGSIEEVEAWPERVRAVTAEEILAAARALFDIRRSVTGFLLPEGKEG